jgi:hypothetical protein
MSSAFNSSWFNYTAMPYRASMAIPGSGITTRQMDVGALGGVTVPTLNVDSSMFEQSQHPEGMTNGVQNWQLPVRLPKNPEYEIGRGELTFVQYSARQSKVNDGTYQVRSLSRLNYHLMMPEMREAYGTKTSCEELMQLWTLYGIQQHDYDHSNHYTYHVGGVVSRVYNIWNATGHNVTQGSKLWLLWRRDRYISPLDSALDTELPQHTAYPFESSPEVTEKRKRMKFATMTFTRPPKKPENSQKKDEDGNPGEFVWGLYPYVSTINAEPPIEVYTTPKWTGDYIYVGKVTHLYGEHYDAGNKNRIKEQKAIFPRTSDAKYREYLYSGNEIELAFRRD